MHGERFVHCASTTAARNFNFASVFCCCEIPCFHGNKGCIFLLLPEEEALRAVCRFSSHLEKLRVSGRQPHPSPDRQAASWRHDSCRNPTGKATGKKHILGKACRVWHTTWNRCSRNQKYWDGKGQADGRESSEEK